MKHIFSLVLLSVIMSGKLRAQNQIRMSFLNNTTLQMNNTDTQFSYHVFVSVKGKQLDNFVMAPNSHRNFVHKFKRKQIAKRVVVSYKYDEDARNADKNRQIALIQRIQNDADNIEEQCWYKVRQLGWVLVAEGLLLGEGKIVDAIKVILETKGKDARYLNRQIELVTQELQETYMSNKRRLWKESVRGFYQQLLLAIEEPFSRCPELKGRLEGYLANVKSLRESLVIYDNRFVREGGQITTKNAWQYASGKHKLVSSFVGLGIEVSRQLATHSLVMADATTKTAVKVASPERGAHWHTEIKAIMPVSRQFKGAFKNFRARMYAVAAVGQGATTFMPTNTGVYLGVRSKTDANPILALNNEGSMRVNYNYTALGLRYMFMPADRMWVSWELGAYTIQETNVAVSANGVFRVDNNELLSSTLPQTSSIRVLNKMPINRYFKAQYSVALFPVAKSSLFPNRKKVVLGVNLGINKFNTSKKTAENELIQINTDKTKITEINPLKVFKSVINIGAGIYLYL